MRRLNRLSGCTCHLQQLLGGFTTTQLPPQASTSRAIHTENARKNTHDPHNAFVSLTEEPDTAARTEGSLSSLKFSIKDNFATHDEQGSSTTCASRMLEGYRSPFEATVVKKLKSQGARIIGKTNMDEFGMGSHGMYSHYGPVKNPLDSERVAGGSSSGAAASVSAGYCDVAIGSDTGGSVRLPASYTGTLGFKPSYGLLSRYGLVAYASSLDTVGIISKKTEHARQTFWALNEHDTSDPTSIRSEFRPSRSFKGEYSQRLRIGIPVECFPSELTEASIAPLRQALAILRSKTVVEIISVSLPSTTKALSAYYTIASAEASSNLARYDGIEYGFRSEGHIQETRTQGFGEEVKKRLILGTYALTADAFDNYFLAAQTLREELKHEMDTIFARPNPLRGPKAVKGASLAETPGRTGVDVLLYPSAISAAPTFEQALEASQGTGSYVQDVLTVPASLAGLPAASCPVPMPGSDQLPVGVQVVGQWGDDDLVLDVAEMLESE